MIKLNRTIDVDATRDCMSRRNFFAHSLMILQGCVFSFIIIASSTKVKTFNTSVSAGGATHSISQARIRQSHVGGNEVNTMHSDGGVVIHLDRVVHVDDRDEYGRSWDMQSTSKNGDVKV